MIRELKCALIEIRSLKHDVDYMDRVTDVLQRAGLIDDALCIVNDEAIGVVTGSADLHKKHEMVEEMVRHVLKYNAEVYQSVSEYEQAVAVEVEKRMKATERAGSTILSAVVSTLKRNGVPQPRNRELDDEGSPE